MATKKRTYIGDQPGLKLIDDDTLISKEEAQRRIEEMQKCKDSIIYFANNYFNVINARGDKIKITVYKKQGEFLEKLLHHNRLVTLQSRQSGKTTSYVIFCLYQIIFQKNYNILIAANTKDTAMGNLEKIKIGYEELPNWIKPSIKEWSKTKISFENGNNIKVSATTASSGRSSSIDLLILDEFAFVEKNIQEEFWRAALPTCAARPLAKIVIVSTPNGSGDKFHYIWEKAISGNSDESSGVWIGHRIDWWDRPDRDEEWHQKELNSLGSEEAFQQEYGNRFTVQAGDKLITDEKIIELKNIAEKSEAVKMILAVDPKKPELNLNYVQYFQYEEGHTYVMGIDSAEGTGRDASIIYILDITNTNNIKLAAKFESAKVIPSAFAYCIYKLYLKYHNPKMMLECNAVGLAVIEALKNIANSPEIINDFKRSIERFNMNDIVNYNRPAGHTGIMSNNQSKSLSMLNLQNIVQSNNFKLILPDDELYKELPFCEKRHGNGNTTYKASKDHHDDHILALNWALFILHKDIIEKYFSIEYKTDKDTQQKYPSIVLQLGADIEEYKQRKLTSNLSMDEAYELAMKWKQLGDHERASFILQSIYDRETEDTAGEWGRNPYEIDQSLFSENFQKRFFEGKYSAADKYYFKPPISDPRDSIEDNMCFGWEF